MTPLVTIIVPIYNVESYLRQCLDSIGLLGSDEAEVLLVNDGSTDGSGAICREYAGRWGNVRVIDKPNGGLSDARNAGTAQARGEYVYYLDSDDWLAPGAVETLLDYAAGSGCEVVQGGFLYAYDDRLLVDNRHVDDTASPFTLTREEAMRELIKNDYVKNFAWGKVYRTDFARRRPFPVGKFYEDSYWQHHMVSRCTRYGVVPAPLYYYRQRAGGISGRAGLRLLHLLEGNEQRLGFVREQFPQFTGLMADRLWRLAFSLARSESAPEFAVAFKRIGRDYEALFTPELKQSMLYHLATRERRTALNVYMFARRVREHFTAPRLKRVDIATNA